MNGAGRARAGCSASARSASSACRTAARCSTTSTNAGGLRRDWRQHQGDSNHQHSRHSAFAR